MYTAEEYRNLLKMVFNLAIHEAEADAKREKDWSCQSPSYNYNEGYIAGLKEGLRKIEVSEFLSNPDYKD